jgi:hypothetical protein
LDVRDDPELAQTREVGRVGQLQVRDVVARVVPAVGLARGLDGVEGAADRVVPQRVTSPTPRG